MRVPVELLVVMPVVVYAGAAAWPVLGSISGYKYKDGVLQTAFVRINKDILKRLGKAKRTPFLSNAEVKFSLPRPRLGSSSLFRKNIWIAFCFLFAMHLCQLFLPRGIVYYAEALVAPFIIHHPDPGIIHSSITTLIRASFIHHSPP
jgi:hypothetical protein